MIREVVTTILARYPQERSALPSTSRADNARETRSSSRVPFAKLLKTRSGQEIDDGDSVVALRNLARAIAGDKRVLRWLAGSAGPASARPRPDGKA